MNLRTAALALLTLIPAAPELALACSPPPAWVPADIHYLIPSDGRRDVAPDTVLAVAFHTTAYPDPDIDASGRGAWVPITPPADTTLELIGPSGPVALTDLPERQPGEVVLRPTTPLVAGEPYTLILTVRQTDPEGIESPVEMTRTSRFVVAASEGPRAPDFGAATLDARDVALSLCEGRSVEQLGDCSFCDTWTEVPGLELRHHRALAADTALLADALVTWQAELIVEGRVIATATHLSLLVGDESELLATLIEALPAQAYTVCSSGQLFDARGGVHPIPQVCVEREPLIETETPRYTDDCTATPGAPGAGTALLLLVGLVCRRRV